MLKLGKNKINKKETTANKAMKLPTQGSYHYEVSSSKKRVKKAKK